MTKFFREEKVAWCCCVRYAHLHFVNITLTFTLAQIPINNPRTCSLRSADMFDMSMFLRDSWPIGKSELLFWRGAWSGARWGLGLSECAS